MSVYKPAGRKNYYLDAVINGVQYRESLKTTDWRKAIQRERERVKELEQKPPDSGKRNQNYSVMDVKTAITAYAEERRAQVSPRMVAYWKERIPALAGFFQLQKLRTITNADMAAYQRARLDAGKAPKTINGEIAVLRQVLKHARLWYRLREDYKSVPNNKPPVGRAATEEEQARLFEVARTRNDWMIAYTAAILGFYCGMRGVEIKGLQWKDVDFRARTLAIRKSKTRAGWRRPTLNQTCQAALEALQARAKDINAADPEHYVFPSHRGGRKIDPTRPITSWRTAWRSIRKKAARDEEGKVIFTELETIRFHDGRHTAYTTLEERGVPTAVIEEQIGHVSEDMKKFYSHIRRRALNEAAAALEPSWSGASS